jgi:hypothetical protein
MGILLAQTYPPQFVRITLAAAALRGSLALRGTDLLCLRLTCGPTSPLKALVELYCAACNDNDRRSMQPSNRFKHLRASSASPAAGFLGTVEK